MPVDGFAWIASAWIDVPTLTGLQQMRLQRAGVTRIVCADKACRGSGAESPATTTW
jgi:hypothetical protein